MIRRDLSDKLVQMAQKFPVVSVTGPRQSGKSTLVRALFPSYRYVTLEDSDMRAFALEDPRSFLARFPAGSIIDEAQRAPDLFSYLQGAVDSVGEPGQYILSGSQNFLLMESVSQSLAGRVSVLTLLPLSLGELDRAGLLPPTIDEALFTGGYPRIFDAHIDPADFYPNYIQTYLERDVRQGAGVQKLAEFERLLGLIADRCSQILNKEGLARDCGATVKTVESWLSVLEASHIALRLQPYYRNFGKRLVKTPKIYLLDTGLVCDLLGIEEAKDIALSPYRGPLVEALVVAELHKAAFSRGRRPKLYFWRDSNGREADLIIERGVRPHAVVEVKSSATFAPRFFKTVTEVGELLGVPPERRFVVYAGDESFETAQGTVLTLRDLGRILE